MRILLYQLIPIVVLLSPFIEVLGLTLYWRRSLSSPWLYGLAGTVVAYTVAGAVMFAVESAKPSGGGTVITSGAAVWRDDGRAPPEKPQVAQSQGGPMFAPLTPSWFALLGAILTLCAVTLWGLRFLFRSSPT
jgi:hypothetical protein